VLLGLLAASATAGELHDGCTASQAAQVEAAFAEAERRVAAGLLLLGSHPSHPHARRWFGADGRDEAIAVLKPTLLRLRPGARPPVACTTGGGCADGETFAIALLGPGRVLLCPRFFAARARGAAGQDSRAGTLVHEASHVAAGTEDSAYQPGEALALARRDAAAAAANADNHQYFVETLPPGFVPEPPRPKGPPAGAPPWKSALPDPQG
jgi:hypothetical protein